MGIVKVKYWDDNENANDSGDNGAKETTDSGNDLEDCVKKISDLGTVPPVGFRKETTHVSVGPKNIKQFIVERRANGKILNITMFVSAVTHGDDGVDWPVIEPTYSELVRLAKGMLEKSMEGDVGEYKSRCAEVMAWSDSDKLGILDPYSYRVTVDYIRQDDKDELED